MTNQEQIEEIKRDIKKALEFDCGKGKCKTCKHINEDNCEIPLITDYLIEQGYRKVPEDAVVLTKEELVKTMESGYVFDTTKGNKINLIEMAREIERKETAKRIYEKAKKKKYIDNDDEGCYWGAIALDDLADICGVEVEE